MIRIFGALLTGVVLVGLLLYSQQSTEGIVVSGFVEADEIRVGSRVGGRVLNVYVTEGESVVSGDILVELEPFDLRERRAEGLQKKIQAESIHDKLVAGFRREEIGQARARRQQLQAALEKLRNGPRLQEIAAAEARLRLAESQHTLANKVYQRVESIYANDAVDRNTLDEAATAQQVARADVEAQAEQLELLKEGSRSEDIERAQAQLEEADQQLKLRTNGYRSEEIREAKARLDAAIAAAEAIERQLDELRVSAPCDSVVEAIELQPGDLLAPNTPAVALVNSQEMWVRAYVPENHLYLQNGQVVQVQVDSFPDRTFAAEITFVARQAEFTPGNVQTPEERSKQVFRIKARLTEGLDVLRPGMAADVILARPASVNP